MWRAALGTLLLECVGCNQIFGLDPAQVIDSGSAVQCSTEHPDCDNGLVCDTAQDQCVECVPSNASACPASTPTCGSDDHCHGCVLNSDCSSEICDRNSTNCVTPSVIAYVDGGSGSDNASCDQATPCRTVNGAVSVLATTGKHFIQVHGTVGPGSVIPTGVQVEIVGDDGAALIGSGDGLNHMIDQTALLVQGNAVVTIRNLKLTKSGEAGLELTDTAQVTALACDFSDNPGAGVYASIGANDATSLSLSQSYINRNRSQSITISGGTFSIVGNEIFGNGSGVYVRTTGSTPALFQLNTITHNNGPSSTGTGFVCDGQAEDDSHIAVDSNIIADNTWAGSAAEQITPGYVGGSDTFISNCVYSYNLTSGGTTPQDYGADFHHWDGGHNEDLPPAFVDADHDDLTLEPSSPAVATGNPDIDLTGARLVTPKGALRTRPPNRGAY